MWAHFDSWRLRIFFEHGTGSEPYTVRWSAALLLILRDAVGAVRCRLPYGYPCIGGIGNSTATVQAPPPLGTGAYPILTCLDSPQGDRPYVPAMEFRSAARKTLFTAWCCGLSSLCGSKGNALTAVEQTESFSRRQSAGYHGFCSRAILTAPNQPRSSNHTQQVFGLERLANPAKQRQKIKPASLRHGVAINKSQPA